MRGMRRPGYRSRRYSKSTPSRTNGTTKAATVNMGSCGSQHGEESESDATSQRARAVTNELHTQSARLYMSQQFSPDTTQVLPSKRFVAERYRLGTLHCSKRTHSPAVRLTSGIQYVVALVQVSNDPSKTTRSSWAQRWAATHVSFHDAVPSGQGVFDSQ